MVRPERPRQRPPRRPDGAFHIQFLECHRAAANDTSPGDLRNGQLDQRATRELWLGKHFELDSGIDSSDKILHMKLILGACPRVSRQWSIGACAVLLRSRKY